MLVEVEEVVALQELVGELGEAEAVAGSAVEALLDAVLGHHVVYGDVLAHLAGEVEEGEILHPIIIIDHLCAIVKFSPFYKVGMVINNATDYSVFKQLIGKTEEAFVDVITKKMKYE